MDSTYLPLLHLPVELQLLLTTSELPERRHVLATSPTTSVAVLDVLVDDEDRSVQHAALRFHPRAPLLKELYQEGSDCCKAAIARNENAPAEILADAYLSEHPKVKLASLVNPSTPLDIRSGLDLNEASKLSEVGSFLGARVVRSHELLIQNCHLLDEINSFTPMMRRAALGLWDITKDQYDTLVRSGRSKFASAHPLAHSPSGVAAFTIEELITLRSPAADIYLTEHPDLQVSHGQAMLLRDKFHTEPHVIGRLLRRFGHDVVPGTTLRHFISETRAQSGAWYDPLVMHFNKVSIARFGSVIQDLESAVTILGENLTAWQNFHHLEKGWEGSAIELAQASKAL